MAHPPSDRAALGAFGEALAGAFLERRGGRILARNLTGAAGEIDLLVGFGGELAAVEVRTTRRRHPAPELISYRKEQQMRWLAACLDPAVFRVDLITVQVRPSGVSVRWFPRI